MAKIEEKTLQFQKIALYGLLDHTILALKALKLNEIFKNEDCSGVHSYASIPPNCQNACLS